MGCFKLATDLKKEPLLKVSWRKKVNANNAVDYSVGGSIMPGRSYVGVDYRYAWNGAEKDDEVKGTGNHYDLGFRMYDPRLVRMFSVDPLASKYAWQSPYAYYGNSPIWIVDYKGAGIWDDIVEGAYAVKDGFVAAGSEVASGVSAGATKIKKVTYKAAVATENYFAQWSGKDANQKGGIPQTSSQGAGPDNDKIGNATENKEESINTELLRALGSSTKKTPGANTKKTPLSGEKSQKL
jgi:RHS repeat-associated protein